MKKIKFNIILLIVFVSMNHARAQDLNVAGQADSLLSLVTEHNPTLVYARSSMEASRLEAGTGITPADPEVEFGYMTGNPSSIGNRFDFSVSQQFDFPTAYFQMADAKEIRQEQAALVYEITRQYVLTEFRKLVIERIHLNQMEALLSSRMDKAGKLKNQYKRMVETGEVGKLSLSQVNLQLSMLKSELEKTRSEIIVNHEKIMEITGGVEVKITGNAYPLTGFPDSTELGEAYADSPESKFYAMQTDLKKKEQQVAVSKALPDLTAGYYSETVINEGFRGISLGISVPLWENKNKLKLAKAQISVAEAENARFQTKQKAELNRYLERRRSLLARIDELNQALQEVDDEELLSIALEVGEISLSEYVFSSEFYLQNVKRLMEYERDLRMMEAEILKVLL